MGVEWTVRRMETRRKKRKKASDPTTLSLSLSLTHRYRSTLLFFIPVFYKIVLQFVPFSTFLITVEKVLEGRQVVVIIERKSALCNPPLLMIEMLFVQWQIKSGVTEVQEAVLQQEPRLAKAMIPVPTLHITLLVTHLANQEQVDLWVHGYIIIYTNSSNIHGIYTVYICMWQFLLGILYTEPLN